MASLPPPPPPPPVPNGFDTDSISPAPSIPAVPSQTTEPVPDANQSANVASDTEKSWEKPWNPSTVRAHAKKWSLAGDTGLLLYLKEMSKDLISRTHTLGKEIDELSANIKTCEVNTNNTFNEFITLANTQFVENRVYDEDLEPSNSGEGDDSADKQNQNEKSKEQVELELIPKISEAVKLGLNVLDTAYEKLDTNIEEVDSDDEDGYHAEPMLEVKDPYVLRSLPVLIGSDAFHQQDNVGLVDVPSDDEASDHGSISESEEEVVEEDTPVIHATHLSDYSYSDSDEEAKPSSSRRPVKAFSSESESGSESEDDEKPSTTAVARRSDTEESETEAVATPGAPLNFSSELAKKLGGSAVSDPSALSKQPSKSKRSDSKSSVESKKDKKKKKKKPAAFVDDDEDMFGTAESDDDGLFSSRGGLFDTGGGLFDNKTSQDDGGLFDDVADVDVRHLRSKEELSSEDESLPAVTAQAPAKPKQAPVKKAAATTNLFDSDSDDDDMFSQPAAKSKPPASKTIFDEEDDESGNSLKPPGDVSRTRTASGRKVPAGAVSMFGTTGGGNPLASALSKRRVSSSSSEEDDASADDSKEEKKPSLQSAHSPAAPVSKSTGNSGGGGLFSSTDSDNDGGDDLFGSSSVSKPTTSETKKKLPPGAVSLFGNNTNPLAASIKKRADTRLSNEENDWSDEESEKDATEKKSKPGASNESVPETKPASSGGLFEDDDNEDDLFGSNAKSSSNSRTSKKPAGGVSVFGSAASKPKVTGVSLFGDEDDDNEDLFSTTAKSNVEKKNGQQATAKPSSGKTSAKGLFSDSDDDGDLFSSAPLKSNQTPSVFASNKSANKSLFSDSGEESPVNDNPLNVPVSKQPPAKPSVKQEPAITAPVTKAPASKGLFSDSDDDMFGSEKLPSDKPGKATANPPNVKQPPASKGLFSDSDDNDMFTQTSRATKPDPKLTKTKTPGPFDESDDDMFSGKDKEISKSAVIQEAVDTKNSPSVKPAVTKGGLFSSESDDDLFSAQAKSKPLAKEEKSSGFHSNADAVPNKEADNAADTVEVVKPKRPAGAVSMFGGLDPTALLKKKKGLSKDEPQSSSAKPIDSTLVSKSAGKNLPAQKSLFDSDSSDDDLFSNRSQTRKPPSVRKKAKAEPTPAADVVSTDDPLQPAKSEPLGKPKSSVSVGKVSNSPLGINPLALMPGAAPPRKEQASAAVGFDTPAVTTNVLHSMNKSRAKIQQKRKPPSRFSKAKAPLKEDTTPSPSAAADTLTEQNTDRLMASAPLVGAQVDTDSQWNNSKSKAISKTASAAPSSFLDSGSDSDDIFSSKTKPPSLEKKTETNNLFSSNLSSATERVEKSATSLHKGPLDADNDDMFSKPVAASVTEQSPATSELVGNNKEPENTQSISDDDSLPLPKHVEVKAQPKVGSLGQDAENSVPSKAQENKDFTLDDSDDDIFSSKASKKSTKSKPVVDIFDDEDLFGPSKAVKSKGFLDDFEDEDDLFSSTLKSASSKKTAKAVTKDEDIFGDDDIFADLEIKSKEKKSKATNRTKKSTASNSKPSVFDDDMDDMFADLGSSKPKKSKKLNLDDDDLFGDPLGGLK